MTDIQKEILIEKMINCPTDLTDEELMLILSDEDSRISMRLQGYSRLLLQSHRKPTLAKNGNYIVRVSHADLICSDG